MPASVQSTLKKKKRHRLEERKISRVNSETEMRKGGKKTPDHSFV